MYTASQMQFQIHFHNLSVFISLNIFIHDYWAIKSHYNIIRM